VCLEFSVFHFVLTATSEGHLSWLIVGRFWQNPPTKSVWQQSWKQNAKIVIDASATQFKTQRYTDVFLQSSKILNAHAFSLQHHASRRCLTAVTKFGKNSSISTPKGDTKFTQRLPVPEDPTVLLTIAGCCHLNRSFGTAIT